MKGEKWANRSSGDTNANGMFYNNWSSVNQTIGWYSAVVLANRTYYKYASTYALFEITQDETSPYVNITTPEGWLNYSNVTFTYFVNDSNLVIDNCTLILNNQKNVTNDTITNDDSNTITVDFLGDPIRIPVTPYRLAAMRSTPIAVVFSHKVGHSRYIIEVPGIIRVPTCIDRNPDVYLTYAQEFIGYLTEYVQKHPFGFYNFFQMWNCVIIYYF